MSAAFYPLCGSMILRKPQLRINSRILCSHVMHTLLCPTIAASSPYISLILKMGLWLPGGNLKVCSLTLKLLIKQQMQHLCCLLVSSLVLSSVLSPVAAAGEISGVLHNKQYWGAGKRMGERDGESCNCWGGSCLEDSGKKQI